MKVLQLSSEKSWRGGEQQIAYLISYLRSQGVEVVVCSRKDSAFSAWCRKNEVKYYELGFKNGLDFTTARRIKKIARQEKVNLINAHSGKSHSLVYWACRMGLKISVVVHRRVDFPLKTRGISLAKYNLAQVRAIVCVSQAIASMVKSAVKNPDRVKTIHSGINPDRFSHNPATGYLHEKFQISKDKPLIANVSALSPHKDYPTFLKVVHEIVKRGAFCHFLIVGDGPDADEIKAMAHKMKLDSHLTFTGFRDDVPQIFREISLFLITSKTEGLGTTVIDALFNKIPVVATRAGGIPELVEDGNQGFLCPIGDYKCLAYRVSELLDSPPMRDEMAQRAFEKSKHFTSDKMGEKVLAIYREILSEPL